MSFVPGEVLRDILLPLDRSTLDDVQFTNRRFLQLITGRMSDVCLRQVLYADFRAPSKDAEGTSSVGINSRPERNISNTGADTARLFADFVQALRSSRVWLLTLERLTFTPELAALALQTPIVAIGVRVAEGSCTELTPPQFQRALLHFSPASLDINTCYIGARQITDEFVRALCKARVWSSKFPNMVPADGDRYGVTDDAIVDFCVHEDVPNGQEGYATMPCLFGELVLYNGNFTKDLFKRLIEASSSSMRTQPLRIVVFPLTFEEEDLREFAQHLSYRHRGEPRELRTYNFPGEQHGTDAATHLQIVLHPDKRLEMIRDRIVPRPHQAFSAWHQWFY